MSKENHPALKKLNCMRKLLILIPMLAFQFLNCQEKPSDQQIGTYDSTIVFINMKKYPRDQIGQLINKVNQFEPKVIAIDARFDSLTNSVSDSILASSISNSGRVILPVNIDNTNMTFHRSHPAFTKGILGEGAISYLMDEHGQITSYIPIFENKTEQSFSFPNMISVNFHPTPNNELTHFRVNQQIKVELIKQLSDFAILNEANLEAGQVKDRIVIIGDLGDEIPTGASKTLKSNDRKYSLVVTANIILSLIKDQ